MKKDKGITMVVLIITIIIMLILTGVAIYGIQNSGVLESAQDTVERSNEKTKKEERVENRIEQEWINEASTPVKTPTKINSTKVYTVTGVAPITLTQSTGANLVNYKIYGKCTQQSGTPSMTSPKSIQSVGDLVTNTGDANYGKYKIPVTVQDGEGNTTTTNIYLNEPLRATNDAVDYIDFSEKKCYRNVAEKVFNGTETWSVVSSSSGKPIYFRYVMGTGQLFNYVNSGNQKCNYAPYGAPTSSNTTNGASVYLSSTTCYFRIRFANQPTTASDMKTLVKSKYDAGNPIRIIYGRKTTLVEDVQLPAILTSEGTNTITIGTTIQPSNVEIQYKGEGF